MVRDVRTPDFSLREFRTRRRALGHFAESTLLSHDIVSDGLLLVLRPNLIIRACIFLWASGTGIDARGLSRKIASSKS